MKIISISNQKGGVGKSVISTHLAMALREKNKRVLFVDLDPQANSTKTMTKIGATPLANASLFFDEAVDVTPKGELALISADSRMADIERADPKVMRYFSSNLQSLSEFFDFCVIDSPPSLGLRMSASLIAADYVLSPLALEEYSIDGVTRMLQTIFGVRDKWNTKLQFLGMLPNLFNPRSQAQKERLEQLINKYPHLLIPKAIGIRTSIPEALYEGVPVWDVKKTAARTAAKEMLAAFDIIFEKMEIK